MIPCRLNLCSSISVADNLSLTTGSNPDGSFLSPGCCANKSASSCLSPAKHRCGGCLSVDYCSKECQINDWARHKKDCKKARLNKQERCPTFEDPSCWKACPLTVVCREDENGIIYATRPTVEEILNYESKYNIPGKDRLLKPYPDGIEPTQYLWRRTPPFDILNLALNEGLDYNKNLAVCFEGAEDLRHVMKTILSLPEHYEGVVLIAIGEDEFDLQLRNVLILLLAAHFPHGQAVELITHLWYSASIPSEMYDLVTDKILPLLKQGKDFADEELGADQDSSLIHEYLTVTIQIGTTNVEMSFEYQQWTELYARLNPQNFERLERVEEKRHNLMFSVNPTHRKRREKYLHSLPPWQRMTEERYRETGILLPLGSEVQHFNIPNPTFNNTSGQFIHNPFASPLDNHDLLKLQETCDRLKLPPNDVHGAGFFETREEVKNFCSRLLKLNSEFIILSYKGAKLASEIEKEAAKAVAKKKEEAPEETADEAVKQPANEIVSSSATPKCQFDRILATRITGLSPDPAQCTLPILAPLLKSQNENPHAAIVAILSSATTLAGMHLPKSQRYKRLLPLLLPYKWYVYSGSALTKALGDGLSSVHELRQDHLSHMEIQEEKLWDEYLDKWHLKEAAGKAGLAMRDEDDMKIAAAWPFRLEMRGAVEEQEEQFRLRFTSMMKGSERFVEFELAPKEAQDAKRVEELTEFIGCAQIELHKRGKHKTAV